MISRRGYDSHRRSGEKGVALMLVLLLVILLSVIVAEFSYEAQVEASLSAGGTDGYAALIAAKSAVAAGFGALHGDLIQQQMYEAGQQVANQLGSLQNQNQKNQATNTGEVYDACTDVWYNIPPLNFNGAEARCWVTDESGKLNLNALVDVEGKTNEFLAETLRVLFRNLQADEQIVDAIIEWLSPMSATGTSLIDTAYGAKGGPMDSIEELLLIPGITPELYFDLNQPEQPDHGLFNGDQPEPHLSLPDLLTVHGDPSGVINVNTVQPPLLEAILEAGGSAAVGDAAQLVEELRIEPVRSKEELAQRAGIQADGAKQVAVKSDFFRIQGDGWVGNTMVRIETYVYRNSEQMMYPDGSQPTGLQQKQDKKDQKPAQNPAKESKLGQNAATSAVQMENFKILDWRVLR